LAQGDRGRNDVFGVHSKALFLKVPETMRQKRSAREKDHARVNLCNNKPTPQYGMSY
jgi:hypothetical protein